MWVVFFNVFQELQNFSHKSLITHLYISEETNMNNYQTIKYKDKDIEMDVLYSIEKQTLYLTAAQIALLFGKDRSVINRHIKNIYQNKELDEASTCAKNAQVQQEGNRAIQRIFKYYNLTLIDRIASRIRSNKCVLLRKYLTDYLNRQNRNDSQIIIYNNGELNLAVNVSPKEETVWLSQTQMALLLDTSQPNISMHINNIIAEGELNFDSVHKISLYTAQDGKRYSVDFYNLDLFLAIGYRVKSKAAMNFRKWASNVLKQYLIKGYALDINRIPITRENITALENEVKHIKEDIEDMKEKMFIEPIKQRIFFDGQFYDAYEFVCGLFSKAKNRIIIEDPYFDREGFKFIKNIAKNIAITICLSKDSSLMQEDIDIYGKQYGKPNILKNNKFHDRYVFVDNECYSLGGSLNQTGNKTFSVIKLTDQDDIERLLNKVLTSPIMNN